MRFFDNPFYLLNTSSLVPLSELQALTKEMGSGQDETISTQAISLLCSPEQRLDAEIRWFPHLEIKDLPKILPLNSHSPNKSQCLISDNFVTDFKRNPIALLTLEVYLFSLFKEHEEPDVVIQYITNIQKCFAALTPNQVLHDINNDRKKVNIELLSDNKVVAKALETYGQELAEMCLQYIIKLPVKQKIGPTLAKLINSSNKFNSFSLVLSDSYAQLLSHYIDSQVQVISTYLNQRVVLYKQTAQPTERVQSDLEKILHSVRYWCYLALPLQKRQQHLDNTNYAPATKLLRLICNFARILACCCHRSEEAFSFLEEIRKIFNEQFCSYYMIRRSMTYVKAQPSLMKLISNFTNAEEKEIISIDGNRLTTLFLYLADGTTIYLPKITHICFHGCNGEVILNSLKVTIPLKMIPPLKKLMLPYLSSVFLFALQNGIQHTVGNYTLSFNKVWYDNKEISITDLPHINKTIPNSYVLNALITDLKKNDFSYFYELLSCRHSSCFKGFFKPHKLELQGIEPKTAIYPSGCGDVTQSV